MLIVFLLVTVFLACGWAIHVNVLRERIGETERKLETLKDENALLAKDKKNLLDVQRASRHNEQVLETARAKWSERATKAEARVDELEKGLVALLQLNGKEEV